MSDNFADVQQSFNRCLMRRDFLRRFYTLFIERDERIRDRFRDTNWDMQVQLLRHGISASLLYATGGDLGSSELERLSKTHSKKGLDIPAWMYDEWMAALLQTIRETDESCDDALEARWRKAMEPAISRMRKGR